MKICSVNECNKVVHAKGMCKPHYLRWHRHGSTEKVDRKATSPRGKDLPQTKHGLHKHPLYATWHTMMARCYNKNSAKYHRYGGRGIAVCERWHQVENFVFDMRDKPHGKSIDRIDNDGNYCPENVRWSTPTEQARNRPQASIPQWKRDEAIRLYEKNGSPKLTAELLELNISSVKNIVYLHKRQQKVI